MKLRGLIYGIFGQRASRNPRASPIVTPYYHLGMPQLSDWSASAAIKEGYKSHIAVYRCVTELSHAVASVPWVVKKVLPDGGAEEAPYDHPSWQLVRKANPHMSWSSFVGGVSTCLLLAGNHYTLVITSGDKAEFYPLRPDRVQVVPGKTGPAGYLYRVNGHEVVYPAEEIVHHRFYDPGSDYYGLSPLRAAARIVDTDNAMLDWNRYSMQNRTRPDAILAVKEKLTEAQHAALLRQIEEQRSGPPNARRVIVISGSEVTWSPMSLTPVELDFVASHRMSTVDVCMAFGIHPEALGLIEATYENKKWAIRAMWEGPILRLLVTVREGFNLYLSKIWGDDIFLDFDLSETPAVVDARRDKAEEARLYWQMGLPFNTINRELGLDFDPVPGGDIGYLPVSFMPVFSGETDRRAGFFKRAVQTPAQKLGYWRTVDQPKLMWERKIANLVRRTFREEREEILTYIKNGGRDPDVVISAREPMWAALLMAAWQAVVEYFGGEVFAKLYPEVARSQLPPHTRQDVWTGEVANYVAWVVAEKIRGITETTKKELRKAIAEGIAENETTDEIVDRVREIFLTWEGEEEVPFETSRAYVIARTEVHGAANYGMHVGAKASGAFSYKTWLSAQDERVRDSHINIDGETQPIDEPYSNGLMYPGDPAGPPEEIVMCRCVETYS